MSSPNAAGRPEYPDLADFMSGWFHQDFDINGDTLEEVVQAFRRDVDARYASRLVQDIDRFLASQAGSLDESFIDCFQPDVIPTAFRPTTREFLEAIRQALADAPAT
ncbi:contact-dependent growth inhibition system immunity protein [Mitsuaria sp. GD03876]|uniref:contact-dependent growth inhibition system immunity protein n=1 Tax=Mitsuaria sp. GD03876 TaxID=2975399 RepID=UPI002449D231|nr:contact-dependent growth inhibition system immunity protein [Mitsuaria sp. GD03876]MDH0865069.1 contact-dependent growth inhibition system immunity protein [Mitsuaria sp. GD03876]